ncbi:MAG: SRPBCC family protein [Bacteroidota bacterium]
MKILKYLLYVIVALVLLFFAFGIFKPTVSYGHEVTVDQPAKITWAVSQDEAKFDQWLEGFKSIKLLSGEKGKPGSTYEVVVNPGDGQPDFSMIETFKTVKEYELIEMSFDNEQMYIDYSVSHTESDDGKTTIKSHSITKAKGLVMRSMFAIMDMFDAFQAQEVKNMEALKKVIEENTTDYYPAPVIEEDAQATSVNEQITD